jgi:hypothetical protein
MSPREVIATMCRCTVALARRCGSDGRVGAMITDERALSAAVHHLTSVLALLIGIFGMARPPLHRLAQRGSLHRVKS